MTHVCGGPLSSRWKAWKCIKTERRSTHLPAHGEGGPEGHGERLAVATDKVAVVQHRVPGAEHYRGPSVRQVSTVWKREKEQHRTQRPACIKQASVFTHKTQIRFHPQSPGDYGKNYHAFHPFLICFQFDFILEIFTLFTITINVKENHYYNQVSI